MATMKFTPFSSFLGVDIKLGASIITLFAVLNKVAGIYGVLAMFQGSLSWTQISAYLYSVATLLVFLWGLRGIAEEQPAASLNYAHLYTLDHFIGTVYTATFGVLWWFFVPHDGRRVAHSDAQKSIAGAGESSGLDPQQAKLAAEAVWSKEQGFALAVLIISWTVKIYFILCLYSFALHIRRGTYHQLPISRSRASSLGNGVPLGTRGRSGSYGYSHVKTYSNATTILDPEDENSPSPPPNKAKGKTPPRPAALTRMRSSSILQEPAQLGPGAGMIRSRSYIEAPKDASAS